MRSIKNALGVLLLCIILTACEKSIDANFGGGNSGQGGSLARFTIVNNHLYTVDHENLKVFDITNAGTPIFKNNVEIGFNIEAIFPFEDKLFIASTNAMYIYNISDPALPVQESQVSHFTGCDPIVANDSVAFLTIHGGNACGSSLNVLNIYDISDVRFPSLINSIPMTNPYGLGLKDSILYVCDNGAGMRVLNVKDPMNVTEISVLNTDSYLDVIPSGNLLIGMMTNGIAYFDISDPSSPQKLSAIQN